MLKTLVIYKITFNYASLGANAHTFYIAYEVVNYAKVTINNSNVDLDNGIVFDSEEAQTNFKNFKQKYSIKYYTKKEPKLLYYPL